MKCASYLIDYSISCYSRLDNEKIYQVTALFIGKLHAHFNLSYSDPPVLQPHDRFVSKNCRVATEFGNWMDTTSLSPMALPFMQQ